MRKHQTVYHKSCTILRSQQQFTRVPISPHLHEHLSFSVWYRVQGKDGWFLVFGIANLRGVKRYGCEAVSHRGFALHFLGNQQCWASFHVLIGHSFAEMCIWVPCTFFIGFLKTTEFCFKTYFRWQSLMRFAKINSSHYVVVFSLSWPCSLKHKRFQFGWSNNLSIFSFVACVFGVLSKKHCLLQSTQIYTYVFF